MKLKVIYTFVLVFLLTVDVYAQQRTKPNIIFILADDLGSGELGCYGNTFNETPNLDKLAKSGAKFTQAYSAAPICSPSRAAIVTGQYPARIGITDYLPNNAERYLEPSKYVTVNEALAQVGYKTGLIGKWHLERKFDSPRGSAIQHGFDDVIGTETKFIGDGDFFYPYDKAEGLNTDGKEGEYLTDRQFLEANKFIIRNKEQPFFLFLSLYAVHTRLDAPAHLVDKYKLKFDQKYGLGKAVAIFDKDDRHEGGHLDNPYLAAMIESIDVGIGNLMAQLKVLGLDENTMVIFFSDNGGVGRVGNNGIFRAGKSWLYEGGIRENLIVNWPKHILSKTIIEEPVYGTDFYPTFLEMAHAKQHSDKIVDGRSFLPFFSAEKIPAKRAFYWHYISETGKWVNRMCSAIRYGDYKLLYFYKDKRMELYHLKNDPSEKNNLAGSEPEKVKELKTMLDKWLMDVHAEEPDLSAVNKKN